MAWKWWQIQAVADTMPNEAQDQTIEVELDVLGTVEIRFICGFNDSIGVIFQNYLLFPNMNDRNPYTKYNKVGATIIDGNIWVGINEDA